MRPRMRPSSTRRLIPSSATVVPKTLRRPRASMHVMVSGLLFWRVGWGVLRGPFAVGSGIQQFFGGETESLNGGVDPWPLFLEKLLTLALQQQIARAGIDEHAAASLALDELLVDQLLIALQDRDRIDAELGSHRAHGRERIALVEHAVEDHGDDTSSKLSVDRLTVVPFAIHS